MYDIFGMLKLTNMKKNFCWSVHNVQFLLGPPTFLPEGEHLFLPMHLFLGLPVSVFLLFYTFMGLGARPVRRINSYYTVVCQYLLFTNM